MSSDADLKIRSTRLSRSDLLSVADDLCRSLDSFKEYEGSNWLSRTKLATLIELASYDIHGCLTLRVDGDCFVPPECVCNLHGWSGRNRGAGGCANEAILRAMRIRAIREKHKHADAVQF